MGFKKVLSTNFEVEYCIPEKLLIEKEGEHYVPLFINDIYYPFKIFEKEKNYLIDFKEIIESGINPFENWSDVFEELFE